MMSTAGASAGQPTATTPSTGDAGNSKTSPEQREGLLSTNWGIVGVALSILGVILLSFVLDISVISGMRHSRDQKVALATYRYSLANSTAPVGQLDAAGHLYGFGTPMAYLTIPRIKVTEVVGEGTTSSVLMQGPGHRRDTAFPGQAGVSVIFGRRAAYGGPFRDLAKLRVGDAIVVTTGQGVQKFKVVDVRTARSKIPPLASGAGRLTLETANGRPYVPKGIIYVDADLTSKVQPYPPRPLTAAGLLPSESAMAGDSTAWLPLVLWGELLLFAALAVAWFYARWGKWQAWLVGVPLLLVLGFSVADQVAKLLPNLL